MKKQEEKHKKNKANLGVVAIKKVRKMLQVFLQIDSRSARRLFKNKESLSQICAIVGIYTQEEALHSGHKKVKMSRHISSVLDITPGKKSWTVLLQVLENGHVQQSRSGNNFRRLVLTDSKGTMFTALIYSSHLRYFSNLLKQYKRYHISNAILIKNDLKYQIGPYEYSWVLNNRTLIEELTESIPATLPCQFQFTAFRDLYKHADTESLLNVRAVVLQCLPSKEQGSELGRRRDIVIVNEEKKLMLMTLWNLFDEKDGHTINNIIISGPMIFAMRVKVTTFNSLSLSTRTFSGIMINPPAAEELQMKEWYNTNKTELQHLLESKSYKDGDILLPYPTEDDIIPLSTAVVSLNTLKTAWIKGKMTLPKQERGFWHTACANCQKSIGAELNWIVTCTSCMMESEVQAMSRMTVVIDDGTAIIRATISTPEVEKFIPFTALDLKQADENGDDLHDHIAMSLNQQTIVAFIRAYEVTFRGQSERKLHIVKSYSFRDMLPPINIMKGIETSESSKSPVHILEDEANDSNKEQLFTPSTKVVLEGISSAFPPKPSMPAKRSLPFSLESETSLSISQHESSTIIIKKEPGSQVMSPSPPKKTKESIQ